MASSNGNNNNNNNNIMTSYNVSSVGQEVNNSNPGVTQNANDVFNSFNSHGVNVTYSNEACGSSSQQNGGQRKQKDTRVAQPNKPVVERRKRKRPEECASAASGNGNADTQEDNDEVVMVSDEGEDSYDQLESLMKKIRREGEERKREYEVLKAEFKRLSTKEEELRSQYENQIYEKSLEVSSLSFRLATSLAETEKHKVEAELYKNKVDCLKLELERERQGRRDSNPGTSYGAINASRNNSPGQAIDYADAYKMLGVREKTTPARTKGARKNLNANPI